jgi:hypothetical protein
MASGVNSDFAAPVRKPTGRKTMQMAKVETNAGTAICCAPSRISRLSGLPRARLRWMFSISTVASSTRMPTASAMPPSVIELSVWPRALRTRIETRIESGIESATIRVLRQLPRKRRIMSAVRPAAMAASWTTPSMEARTKTDWSNRSVVFSASGRLAMTRGKASRTRRTMSSVEAPPALSTVSRLPRWPLVFTMFVCTA